MLTDHTQNHYGPIKGRHIHHLYMQCTFASGIATIDAAKSAGGLSIQTTAGSSGVYTMTFPKCSAVQAPQANVDPGGGAITAGGAAVRGVIRAVDASAGTCTVTFTDGAGTPENPADGSRAYFKFEIWRL